MSHIAAFFAVSVVVIVTPGQDTALTIRNALLGRRRSGLATAAGVATGQAVWAVAASAGVAAVLRASEPAFLAVRLAGAVYLVYLGAHGLVAAVRRKGDEHSSLGKPMTFAPRAAYRQGVVSNLGNPKMAIFFTSLLPQFGTGFGSLLALGVVFAAMTLTWLTGYAVVVAKAGGILRRGAVRRWLDAVTGACLVAFGLRLATER